MIRKAWSVSNGDLGVVWENQFPSSSCLSYWVWPWRSFPFCCFPSNSGNPCPCRKASHSMWKQMRNCSGSYLLQNDGSRDTPHLRRRGWALWDSRGNRTRCGYRWLPTAAVRSRSRVWWYAPAPSLAPWTSALPARWSLPNVHREPRSSSGTWTRDAHGGYSRTTNPDATNDESNSSSNPQQGNTQRDVRRLQRKTAAETPS